MDPDRPIVRWSLVVLWALVALMLYEPAVALFGWPLLLLAFAGGVIWTAQDFTALQHQTEVIREGHVALAMELVVLGAIAGGCVVLASVTAISNDGHEFALSKEFAPSLMAVLLVMVLRALRAPTPRRLAVVSLISLGVVPILATIQILGVTNFGFGDFRVVSPMIVTGYSICTLAIGAVGIHLGVVARRHGYGEDIPARSTEGNVRSLIAILACTCGCGFHVSAGSTVDGRTDDADDQDPDAIEGMDALIDAPASLPSNLVAYWPMEALTNNEAIDVTGHGHMARCGTTTTTCPDVVAGFRGNGFSFDGATDRLDVVDTVMLHTTTAFTLAFWVKFTTFSNQYACPAGKFAGASTGQSNSYQLCNTQDDGGRWFFGAAANTGAFTLIAASGPAVGTWYHGAITWDEATDTKTIWIDGQSAATETGVSGIQFDSGRVTLGADLSNGMQADRFAGILDDVRIYNTALSGSEIMALTQ